MSDLGERIAHAAQETSGRTVTPPFAVVAHRASAARTRHTVTIAAVTVLAIAGGAAAIPRLGAAGLRPARPAASGSTEPPGRDVCYVGPRAAAPLVPCRRTVVETRDPSFDDPPERICPGRLEGGAARALSGTFQGHEWVVQGYRIGEESCEKATVDGRLTGLGVGNGPRVDDLYVSAGRIPPFTDPATGTLLWGAMKDDVVAVTCTAGGDTYRAATGTTWLAPRTVFFGVAVPADPSLLRDATCVGYGADGGEIIRTTLPPSDRH